jgi:uncharacterized lipoprotein YmbA
MKQLLLVCAALILTACAGGSPAPDVNYYLLRSDVPVPQGRQEAPAKVGIGQVRLASYLNQNGIVIVTEGDKVRPARQHLWAEPLGEAVRLYLRDELSDRAGVFVSGDTSRRFYWDYRIDVTIDKLHGTLDGDVVIRAGWRILDTASDTELANHQFEAVTQQQEDGYQALIAAEKELLDQLSDAMAATVRELQLPPDAA